MSDEPRKIFDLTDIEVEPTDEQLAELMHLVGEDIRAETARINERAKIQNVPMVAEKVPPYGMAR